MALPKINNTSKYKITIPSTQQQVTHRPYLVKEEKVLMIAMESKDQKQVLGAVVDTIVACIIEDIDPNKLTTFDIEYLFLKIRSKSVGETTTVGMRCTECNHVNKVAINFEDIKVSVPAQVNKNIKLTDTITLKMKWPAYNDMVKIDLDTESPTDLTFKMIIQCMDTIATNDEMIKIADEPTAAVIDFLENLTTEQFTQIRDFIDSVPKVTYEASFICSECGAHNQRTLQGMDDFF